jgi:hypothetical protein
MTVDLKNLQSLLHSAITAESRTTVALEAGALLQHVRGDKRLPALECVAIYADAYFYRLHDCLREDFPATVAVMGGPGFEELAHAYLSRHPPTEPSIFHAGWHLPDFLMGRWPPERRPFLAELARLERTLIEVFHAPDAPVLGAAEIQLVRPQDWHALNLQTHPALHTLDCWWRVNDVLHAVENGNQWKQPELGPVLLLVWRQNNQVYYRELSTPERAALEALSNSGGFAAVCEAFASWFDGDDPATAIAEMLARWLADGLLARV